MFTLYFLSVSGTEANMSDCRTTIPIIDFERIGLQREENEIDKDAFVDIGRQMKDALQKYGFFYAQNHGISMEAVKEIMASAKDFFQGPVEKKQPHFRGGSGELGWIGMGTERSNQDFQADLKEVFNYHPADERNVYLKTNFRERNKDMFSRLFILAMRVLDTLSTALGYDLDLLRKAHQSVGQKNNQTLLRNLFYPGLPPVWEVTPGQVRLGEHTDYGSITLHFQDSAGGLEMNTPTMGYLPVTPIPGTMVIFVGSQMQHLTADKLIAGKHKILVPDDEVKARQERQSMTLTLRVDDNYIIKCLDGSDKYQPTSSIEYLNHRQMEVIVSQ